MFAMPTPREVTPPQRILVLTTLEGVYPKAWPILPPRVTTGAIAHAVKPHLQEPLATSEVIRGIKQISGLTWGQLASLFNRSLRTVHLWAEGQGTDAETEELLQRVHALIQPAVDISPLTNRRFLVSVVKDGKTTLDFIKSGDIENAKDLILAHAARATSAIAHREAMGAKQVKPLPPAVLMTARTDLDSLLPMQVVKSKAKRLSRD